MLSPASSPKVSEEELLSAALSKAGAGRRAAILALLQYLEPVIRVRANRLLESKHGAAGLTRDQVDDLVQEVWAYLFADNARVLRSWDPKKGRNLRSFVAMVATRCCIDLLRGRRLNPYREVVTDHSEIERDAALVDSLETRAVSRSFLEWLVSSLRELLSEEGGLLLQVMYLEGASPEEAERQTGISRSKIYNQRRRISALARRLVKTETASGGV